MATAHTVYSCRCALWSCRCCLTPWSIGWLIIIAPPGGWHRYFCPPALLLYVAISSLASYSAPRRRHRNYRFASYRPSGYLCPILYIYTRTYQNAYPPQNHPGTSYFHKRPGILFNIIHAHKNRPATVGTHTFPVFITLLHCN